ncbi:MAG: hypothetical protein ACFHU9_02830 [Fluviicola sp.]
MKPFVTFIICLLLLSCNEESHNSESAQRGDDVNLKSDSVSVWACQFHSYYKLNTCEFVMASFVYGGVLYLEKDTLYHLSITDGLTRKSKVNQQGEIKSYRVDSRTHKLSFNDDVLLESYVGYYFPEYDSTMYDIIEVYAKRTVSRNALDSVINHSVMNHKGFKSDTLPDEFMGLQMDNWIVNDELWKKNPRCPDIK